MTINIPRLIPNTTVVFSFIHPFILTIFVFLLRVSIHTFVTYFPLVLSRMAEEENKRIQAQRAQLGESGLADKKKQLEEAVEFNEVRFL